MYNNIPRFATLEEAKDYFMYDSGLSSKYDMLLCYVGDTYTCLMGTAMVEDNHTRGPIEEIVEKFLNEIDAPIDIDDATMECGAEMTNAMYEVLARHGVDVEFVFDTF